MRSAFLDWIRNRNDVLLQRQTSISVQDYTLAFLYLVVKKTILMKKSKKYNPDDLFFNGLTINDILGIAKLATTHDINWDGYDLSKLTFGVYQASPSPYNDFCGLQYALMNIPLRHGNAYHLGFELKIFEDGYVSYENGLDVKMKISNAIQVYKILGEKLTDIVKPKTRKEREEEASSNNKK